MLLGFLFNTPKFLLARISESATEPLLTVTIMGDGERPTRMDVDESGSRSSLHASGETNPKRKASAGSWPNSDLKGSESQWEDVYPWPNQSLKSLSSIFLGINVDFWAEDFASILMNHRPVSGRVI